MENVIKSRRSFGAFQAFMLLLLLLVIGVGGYFFYQNTQLQKKYDDVVNNPSASQKVQEEKAKITVENLKKILFISGDEQPAVATIVDADKVRASNKEFYQDAQNGDALVVYSARAIIYRETENKIINIAPIINPNGAGTTGSTASSSSSSSTSK